MMLTRYPGMTLSLDENWAARACLQIDIGLTCCVRCRFRCRNRCWRGVVDDAFLLGRIVHAALDLFDLADVAAVQNLTPGLSLDNTNTRQPRIVLFDFLDGSFVDSVVASFVCTARTVALND